MCPKSAHRGVQAPAQAFCGVLCPSQSCTRLFLQCIMCQLRSKHVSYFTVQKLDDSQLATFRKGLGKLLFPLIVVHLGAVDDGPQSHRGSAVSVLHLVPLALHLPMVELHALARLLDEQVSVGLPAARLQCELQLHPLVVYVLAPLVQKL